MITKKHFLFNVAIIVIPWLSLLFIGKQNLKRYSFAGIFIVVFEIINHIYGHRRNWWKFYDKKKAFWKDELPFSIGPYLPLSLWFLKYSFGDFKKFTLLNAICDGLFAFVLIDIFKKMKIVSLGNLGHLQFFLYLHYKAYILYGVQSIYEKFRKVA